jgi:flagellar motility protein MotE (MotC chaperone)
LPRNLTRVLTCKRSILETECRRKRDELEQQLERRRADQEAQKIKVVEETERLREIYALALQEMTALQGEEKGFC